MRRAYADPKRIGDDRLAVQQRVDLQTEQRERLTAAADDL